MESVFVGVAVIAFVLMVVALLWPKPKKQHRARTVRVEPPVLPTKREVAKTPDGLITSSYNLSMREARELFTALRKK